jgi:hypothetical protein
MKQMFFRIVQPRILEECGGPDVSCFDGPAFAGFRGDTQGFTPAPPYGTFPAGSMYPCHDEAEHGGSYYTIY